MIKNIITLTAALIVVALMSSSCILSFDVVPDDIDMIMSFSRDASCADVTGYNIVAGEPYDKTFASNLDNEAIIQHWVAMPQGEVPLTVKLQKGEVEYAYDLPINREWGAEGAFSVTCDEGNPKPVLMLDLIPFTAVFTLGDTCRTFKSLELFDEISMDPDSGQANLSQLAATNIPDRRWLWYWHNPRVVDPVMVVRLTNSKDGIDDFRFPLNTEWGQRFDFQIECDPENPEQVSMTLTVGENTYYPDDGSTTDGDVDGDTDGDEDVEADGDMDVTDGDADGDVTDGDTDGDATDGDVTDGDVTDGDEDTDPAEEEPEVEPPCGEVKPTGFFDYYPESTLLPDEGTPPGAASVIDTTNEQFDDLQYVRLDGTAIGDEMVFSIDVAEDWHYILMLTYVGSDDWAVVSVYLDDDTEPLPLKGTGNTSYSLRTPTGPTLDEWLISQAKEYESRCLRAGTHKVRIRISGVNTDNNFTAGIELIRLFPE